MSEEESPVAARSMILPTIVFELGVGVLALAVGNWLGEPPWAFIHWGRPHDWLWGAVATLPLLAMLLASPYLGSSFRDLTRQVRELVDELFAGGSILGLACVSIAAGLGEELFFRGLIQYWGTHYFGIAWGLVAASLLFGLAHPMTRLYLVMATVIGLYLGGLWIYSGNLIVPIIAHALYDFCALCYLRWGPQGA